MVQGMIDCKVKDGVKERMVQEAWYHGKSKGGAGRVEGRMNDTEKEGGNREEREYREGGRKQGMGKTIVVQEGGNIEGEKEKGKRGR